MDELNPDNERCARCGEVASGYAFINDDRYCHPDDPDSVDCYEQAQLPTVDEMHGAFPNFTGGMDAVEYVRRGRDRINEANVEHSREVGELLSEIERLREGIRRWLNADKSGDLPGQSEHYFRALLEKGYR